MRARGPITPPSCALVRVPPSPESQEAHPSLQGHLKDVHSVPNRCPWRAEALWEGDPHAGTRAGRAGSRRVSGRCWVVCGGKGGQSPGRRQTSALWAVEPHNTPSHPSSTLPVTPASRRISVSGMWDSTEPRRRGRPGSPRPSRTSWPLIRHHQHLSVGEIGGSEKTRQSFSWLP